MRNRISQFAGILCALIACEAAAQTTFADRSWIARGDNVAIVFDASYSMHRETDAPAGQSVRKLAVAVRSARILLDRLAAMGVGRDIATIAFGNRYDIVPLKSKPVERQRVCNLDVETLMARQRLTPKAADVAFDAINALKPRGMTPISQSLQVASDQLGPGGGSIVLITDWEDPCGQNDLSPCDMLAKINNERQRQRQGALTLRVILVPRWKGFNVSYVESLRKCSGAELVYLKTLEEAEKYVPVLFPEPPRPAPPPPAPPPSPAAAPPPSSTLPPVAALPPRPPPPPPPPPRLRIIEIGKKRDAQTTAPAVVVQLLDAADRVVGQVKLEHDIEELTASAGSYRAKARFPDGREIFLKLGTLEAGTERDVYVAH